MTPEQRIEKYYLEKIKKYQYEVDDAITTILGESFKKLLDAKKDFFNLVFTASKDGLEYHIGETPDREEKEIMEFLLQKVEEEKKEFTLISTDFPYEKDNKGFYEWLKNNKFFSSTYHPKEQVIMGYMKLDVFALERDGIYQDIGYINGLLLFLIYEFNNNSWYVPERSFKLNCNIENANETIYKYILNTISIQIVALFRQKNIYILDDIDEYDEEKTQGYNIVNPKFIAAFQDLLPLFLLEPQKFIDIVGSDNFRDFTICTLNRDSELDIDEIINKMLMEREKKATYEIIAINSVLIEKAKRKLDEKKAKTPPVVGQAFGFSSRSDKGKYRDLLNYNLKKINNELNNKENIDNIYKDFKNDDDWKYMDEDYQPPRKR